MKVLVTLCLTGLLLTAHGSRAQTVLQGDSVYRGLQPHKDSLASIVARLGKHYRKRKEQCWFHVHWRDGGSSSGTRACGYVLCYKKLGARFNVDSNQKGNLNLIRFDAHSSIISARGIRPGSISFATVIEKYGPSGGGSEHAGQSDISVITHDRKTYYTAIRYPHIAFVSYGKPKPGENLLLRKVREIWLQ